MHTITQCWPASSSIENLFKGSMLTIHKLPQTSTHQWRQSNKLLCYTAHRNTKSLQFSQNTSFLLERKRLSQQVLELSETKNSRCAIRAWGWKLRSILRLNKQLVGSQNNQIPICIIHRLVHNNVCDKSNRWKNTISDNTMDLKWAPHTPLQQPASQLLHALVRLWRH